MGFSGWQLFFSCFHDYAYFFPIIWILIRLVKIESFATTHYPIRFNRKSRRVHFFETNGNVSSASWDEIYFTLSEVDHVHKFWNILGHILDKDRATVLKTFALSFTGTGDREGMSLMRSHWEFVRRYMEDGPEEISGQVEYCLPISETRESFLFGLRRLLANNSGVSSLLLPFVLVSMVFDIITVPFRYFAIQTSKIPKWPENIENECHIEDDDPYAIVGLPDGERKAVYPGAAAKAGVKFFPP